MNSDIRIKLSFRNHRKTAKLRRRLGEGGVLALLWLWMDAAENRPEGVLTGYDEEDIATAAGWSGKPKEFISALIETGWMEQTDDGTYALHDYQEHQPYASRVEERKIKGRYNAYLGHGNVAKASELEAQYPWLIQTKESAGEPQGQAAEPQRATHGDPTGSPMATPLAPPREPHRGPHGVTHAPSPSPSPPESLDSSSLAHESRLVLDLPPVAAEVDAGASPRQPPPQPPVFEIETTSEGVLEIHQDDLDKWEKSFPAIDVKQSIRNMIAWFDVHPRNRSATRKRLKQRVVSWLKRDQDNVRASPAGAGSRGARAAARTAANLQDWAKEGKRDEP